MSFKATFSPVAQIHWLPNLASSTWRDNMRDVKINPLPKLHQSRPILRFIVLNSNPTVIIAKTRIAGKSERTRLVLQMNDPVDIIRCRIDHVTNYLLDIPVLFIAAQGHSNLVEHRKSRLPKLNQTPQLPIVGFEFIHPHPVLQPPSRSPSGVGVLVFPSEGKWHRKPRHRSRRGIRRHLI